MEFDSIAPAVPASDRGEAGTGRGAISERDPGSDGRESVAADRVDAEREDGLSDLDKVRSIAETETRIIPFTLHLYKPHAKQEIFIESPLKRKLIRAGRRGGKTTGLAILAVRSFLEKRRVLYAVPTAEQIARFWFECVQALAEPIELGLFKKYESEHIIELPGTEQRIRAKTAWNADTLRGDYGDLIVLDEYQLMNEDALTDVVLPMLIDNNGDLVLAYTPPSLKSRSTSKANDKRHAPKLYKEKSKDPRWLCLHFTTYENPALSTEGIAEVSADMTEISRRQEIMAEDIDEMPGALWKQRIIDESRVPECPPLIRVVIGIDPPGGDRTECGIVAAGLGADGDGYLIADASDLFATPRAWAAAATWLYYQHKADRILGEENYGGNMVEMTVKIHDENISYKSVTATRGKLVRAEPICALYENHRIHHVGTYPKLESEMCSYVPGDLSPNRLDAMVWAFTELFPERVRLTLAEKQVSDMEARENTMMKKIQKETLAKPMTNDNTLRCPACESKLVVKRGPLFHCNPCGHEWGTLVVAAAQGGRRAI
jgi:DNA-directed RNA polymerase subunit RPC12/RpoP